MPRRARPLSVERVRSPILRRTSVAETVLPVTSAQYGPRLELHSGRRHVDRCLASTAAAPNHAPVRSTSPMAAHCSPAQA
jgi:hypothetical protein